MAISTMELRHLVEMNNFELFDFEYPICDLTWKEEFEQLFIDYFYFYEIAPETPDRFKHNLKTRLRLIMPYYNELYKSTLLEIDPLLTKKINENIKENEAITDKQTKSDIQKTTESSTSSGKTDSSTTESEFPQTTNIKDDIPSRRIGGVDNVSGNTTSSGESSGSSNIDRSKNKIKDYSKIIEGVEGDQNELLRSYRENIININRMIIDELKTLFVLVY